MLVLSRIAELTAEGKQAHWKIILKPIRMSGQPVSMEMIKRWLKTPWGRRVWDEFHTDFTDVTREMVMMGYGKALETQLHIAGDRLDKRSVSAFRNVQKVAAELQVLKPSETQTAPPRSMTIILQQYGGTVAIGNQSPQVVKDLMRGDDDVVDGQILDVPVSG